MGRKKTTAADALVHLIAKLPWWGALTLGFFGWLVFHRLAGVQPDTTGFAQGKSGIPVVSMMVPALGLVLQYPFPLLCVIAALISWIGRRERTALVQTVTHSPSADVLNGMSWREFEMLVGEAFRVQGYTVNESGGGGPDGGVDLVLRKGTETFLVQCKQWKAFKVSVDIVRDLYGVMAARGAAGGFVVTSGTFTPDAKEFASGRNVMLVEGSHLLGLIQRAKASLAGGKESSRAAAPLSAVETKAEATLATRQCPICDGSMVRRTARKGASVGSEFWGCTGFPKCRGTRKV
jgi:restriction system protein